MCKLSCVADESEEVQEMEATFLQSLYDTRILQHNLEQRWEEVSNSCQY